MSHKLLQQALDALKHHRQQTTYQFGETNAAVKALEAELAKPELPRAFREVLIGDNYVLRFYPSDTGWMCGISNEMMDAIEEVRNEP
jgi:hypothetical protein